MGIMSGSLKLPEISPQSYTGWDDVKVVLILIGRKLLEFDLVRFEGKHFDLI